MQIYHICNKSISNYGIFNFDSNAQRFIQTLDYYNDHSQEMRFSDALRTNKYFYNELLIPKNDSIIKFLSYCIMPDHYHILVKIPDHVDISKYISDVENSYTRYFNTRSKRKGPLWQSRYRIVLIESNEHLLHVSRYAHLNPTTAGLVQKPEDWKYSSYREIISNKVFLSDYLTEFSIRSPRKYQNFVENQIDYQKKLKLIKKLLLD